MSEESIFQGNGDGRLTAGVNYPHNAHELMTEGYRRAAQKIVGSLQEEGRGADFLVYPLVFLYRHWFELRLKEIIDQGRILLGEGFGYPPGHNLKKLWPIAKDVMRKYGPVPNARQSSN